MSSRYNRLTRPIPSRRTAPEIPPCAQPGGSDHPRPAGARRCALEVLEDRTVLSTFTPTLVTDTVKAGALSLRNAIIQANADPGTADDTVTLAAGTYRLTLKNTAGQENAAATGDLDITSTAHTLIIQGQGTAGRNRTVIDASALGDRIFQIVNPGTVVELRDLVLQGGTAVDDGSAGAVRRSTDALGGAILNNGGQLTLTDVVVQNNRAVGGNGARRTPGNRSYPGGPGGNGHGAQGGGIYLTGGALTMTGVTMTGNGARGGNGGNGGYGVTARTSATSTVGGGIIYGMGGNGGQAGSAQGGAIFVDSGALTLASSTLLRNTALGGKGGNGGHGAGGDAGAGILDWPAPPMAAPCTSPVRPAASR